MQSRRPWFARNAGRALFRWSTLGLWVCPGLGSALGFGPADPLATLGQPLDLSVAVTLEAGEMLSPECVSAEVVIGARRLPPPLVRTVVELAGRTAARVRVQTLDKVDEPIVQVELAVGCSNRIERRYVVLADPPGMGVAVPLSLQSGLPDAAVLAAAAPAFEAAERKAAAAVGWPRALAPVESVRPAASRPALTPKRQHPLEAAQRADAEPAPALPRLQLEGAELSARRVSSAPESLAVTQAMMAVAEAASAAQAAASAAAASALRVRVLEQELAQQRSEAKASLDLVKTLRAQPAVAQAAPGWAWSASLVALLLAVLAAWLAWRLAKLQAAQRALWLQTATAMGAAESSTSAADIARVDAPAPPAELVSRDSPGTETRSAEGDLGPPDAVWPPLPSTLPPAPPRETGSALQAQTLDLRFAARAWIPEAGAPPPEAPTLRADTQAVLGRSAEAAPRDVSIEELIDLEQQAEFFMVLGQEEAAVDLLMEHLRSTGGASPLPYLKLLEIHQRRGDHAAYERMRQRFNHRFNAYAPDGDVDLTSGRSLEDYPGIVPRLQQVWGRPLEAMAELEALLFRKRRGELFELPAYREVLFLYGVARDLLDRDAVDSGSVDVLLPLNDGGVDDIQALGARHGFERDADGDSLLPGDPGPTLPADLAHPGSDRRPIMLAPFDFKPDPRP
jgi:hypothetical protein